ncbi:MAG: hypothetical protein KBF99_11180 [Leptospiraceae bacterium]|nr:hypothetical protein [Leptospiraceae bacterium]MBK7054000.1 hypothetical protein [Leptospiraceae bacterium]MBL0262543.1 hypothetical protein [Leptospiraceae bacterium]MBP9163737.1 hypothetical protein [Leptospiraceae bacterium]
MGIRIIESILFLFSLLSGVIRKSLLGANLVIIVVNVHLTAALYIRAFFLFSVLLSVIL